MTTTELVEQARALLAAATPGPWTADTWFGEVDGNDGVVSVGPHHIDLHDPDLMPDEPGHSDYAYNRACADAALIAAAPGLLAALCDALAAESKRADDAEAGLCRELIAERDALRAELRLTVDAEVGRAGLPGWRYAGTRLWTRWLGPRDESEEETFPLLHAEHDLSGRWAWEALGPRYVGMAKGTSDGALAAMRACEQAALAAFKTNGREGE